MWKKKQLMMIELSTGIWITLRYCNMSADKFRFKIVSLTELKTT